MTATNTVSLMRHVVLWLIVTKLTTYSYMWMKKTTAP